MGAFVCHRLKPAANEQIVNQCYESLKILRLLLCKKLIADKSKQKAGGSRLKARGFPVSGFTVSDFRFPSSDFRFPKKRLPQIHEKNKKLAAGSSQLASFPVSCFRSPISDFRPPISDFRFPKKRLPRIHEKNKKLAARSSQLVASLFPVSKKLLSCFLMSLRSLFQFQTICNLTVNVLI